MSWTSKLKEIFKELTNEHGPYAPAPEVREKLEQKGYQFKSVKLTDSIPITVPLDVYDIFSPEGKKVGNLFRNRDITRKYEQDYKQAVRECEQEAQNPDAPKGPQNTGPQ